MSKYEAIIVIDSSIGDTEVEAQINGFAQLVKTNGGSVESKDVWGRRKLAYKINKKEYGYYVMFILSVPGMTEESISLVANIEKSLRINEKLLRFLIVSKDKFAPDLSDKSRQNIIDTTDGLNVQEDVKSDVADDTEVVPAVGTAI